MFDHYILTVSFRTMYYFPCLFLILSSALLVVTSYRVNQISAVSDESEAVCPPDCDWELRSCDLTCTIHHGKYKVGIFRQCLTLCAQDYIDCAIMC